jgi:hypothetical protein
VGVGAGGKQLRESIDVACKMDVFENGTENGSFHVEDGLRMMRALPCMHAQCSRVRPSSSTSPDPVAAAAAEISK